MPSKNDTFFSAATCKKHIIFGGHPKQILGPFYFIRALDGLEFITWAKHSTLLKSKHTFLKSIFFFLFSFDGGSTPSSNTGGGSNSPGGSGGPGSGGGGGKSTKGTKRTKDIKLIIDIYNLSDFFSAIFLLIL